MKKFSLFFFCISVIFFHQSIVFAMDPKKVIDATEELVEGIEGLLSSKKQEAANEKIENNIQKRENIFSNQASSLILAPTEQLSLPQRADLAFKRSQEALKKAKEKELGGDQEVANMWHTVSENFQLVVECCNNDKEDDAIALEKDISSLEKYIASFISADKEEKELCFKCNDEPNSKCKKKLKIIKKCSRCPYLRVEEEVDHEGKIIKETRMVADHLLIKLKDGETKESFNEKLSCSEALLEEDSLLAPFYLLRFQPLNFKEDEASALQLLDLMTEIIKKIEKGGFADCVPDFLMAGAGNFLTSFTINSENQLKQTLLNQEDPIVR